MKIMRSSELLSDSEIMDLLKDHQRTSKLSKKEELTEMARVFERIVRKGSGDI
ncbi:hypothetical protein [Lysinibacillus sp. RC79]|uniref:hypothetical protein n=1 Tax=Lysinibacillus sp. RC79 TaxID=3156296 RepID=UPI003515E978